jgi:hypothetical protein
MILPISSISILSLISLLRFVIHNHQEFKTPSVFFVYLFVAFVVNLFLATDEAYVATVSTTKNTKIFHKDHQDFFIFPFVIFVYPLCDLCGSSFPT